MPTSHIAFRSGIVALVLGATVSIVSAAEAESGRGAEQAGPRTRRVTLGAAQPIGRELQGPEKPAGVRIIPVGQSSLLPQLDEPRGLGEFPQVPPAPISEAPPAPVTQFRPITAIQPFFDYEPDGGPCDHLCPQEDCEPRTTEECPEEAPFASLASPDRTFDPMCYMWTASNLYHNPLYFEDVPLERYGHVKCNECVQPFVSLSKFSLQLVGLPYQMALDHPQARRYALGYYRPGDCAPRLHYRVPLNGEAALTSGVFYTGLGFLIP
ncbi:MAG: hypothetical protein KF774_20975 [Planctomyces sp.]|nr:hypothetical protein [Planctomyces sp.]